MTPDLSYEYGGSLRKKCKDERWGREKKEGYALYFAIHMPASRRTVAGWNDAQWENIRFLAIPTGGHRVRSCTCSYYCGPALWVTRKDGTYRMLHTCFLRRFGARCDGRGGAGGGGGGGGCGAASS